MTLLLAVFRRPEMLKVLLSERNGDFDPNEHDACDPYRDRLIPLAQVPEDLCPWWEKDLKAWRSLAKVPNMSPRAAQAIVRSLLSTVVEPGLNLAYPGDIVFGKKAIDLRPSLCHVLGEEHLIAAVGARQGIAEELPAWHWSHRQEIAALPESFRYYFLWRLSLASWKSVELMAAMHQSLALAEKPTLCRALARLAAATEGDSMLWWCDALAEAPVAIQVRATELILAMGVQELRPNAECKRAMQSGEGAELYVAMKVLAIP